MSAGLAAARLGGWNAGDNRLRIRFLDVRRTVWGPSTWVTRLDPGSDDLVWSHRVTVSRSEAAW